MDSVPQDGEFVAPDNVKILVLSSHSHPKISGPVNHQVYATRHGYDYLFDITPLALTTPYDQKLEVIARTMRRTRCDWILWVDDDAYFMQLDKPITDFIPDDDNVDIVICRSPVNLKGIWSYINSGVFLIRNRARALSVFEEAIRLPMPTVEAWWDREKYGHFVAGGDQERLTYLFETKADLKGAMLIHDHSAFNSRAYHFKAAHDEYFVCHLASHRDKNVPLADMIARFGLDKHLLPMDVAANLPDSLRKSFFSRPPILPKPPSLTRRIGRKVKRLVR